MINNSPYFSFSEKRVVKILYKTKLNQKIQRICFSFSEKVAVKILDKTKLDQKTQRLLSREISSMEKLHHPNVIRLYEVVETLAKLYMVMEFAGGGELFTKISNEGKLPEAEARPLFAQILAAVKHMVSIIHNFLLIIWCRFIFRKHKDIPSSL